MKTTLYLIALTLFMLPATVLAQDAKQQPIEVTADQELEWNRAAQTFIARGNAKIMQGADSITAPQITANYTEQAGKTEIQKIIAAPNAVLVQPDQRLTAQTVTADFKDGVLSTIIAEQNVVLKTAQETLYGDQAVYDSVARIIIVTGNVKIEQGQNLLTGTRAEFDLNTNISRMTAGGPGENGRVKAIFYGAEDLE